VTQRDGVEAGLSEARVEAAGQELRQIAIARMGRLADEGYPCPGNVIQRPGEESGAQAV